MTENEHIKKNLEDHFLYKHMSNTEANILQTLQESYTVVDGKAVYTILAGTNMVQYRQLLLNKYGYKD